MFFCLTIQCVFGRLIIAKLLGVNNVSPLGNSCTAKTILYIINMNTRMSSNIIAKISINILQKLNCYGVLVIYIHFKEVGENNRNYIYVVHRSYINIRIPYNFYLKYLLNGQRFNKLKRNLQRNICLSYNNH